MVRTSRTAFFSLMAVVAAATQATAQPSITASITPSPNRFGWNNTAVTISYACAGVMSCPEPISVMTEGSRQLFRQTVTDESGRTATVSTEVNIDLTPAAIGLASPSHDAAVAAATVDVTADLSDALSGVANATCNGDPAPVQGNQIGCVMPLRNGVNDLVVQVIDRAGNSSSTGVQVHRTGEASSITVVPSSLTLPIDQSNAPQVVDDFGRTLSDVDWSIEDQSVVSLGKDDQHTLTPVGPGITTVTATWRMFTSSMNVRVLPVTRLPDWTDQWSLEPLPGYRYGDPTVEFIKPVRASDDTPTLITIEHEISGSRLMLRALDDATRQLWIEAPAISSREHIGEQHSGDEMGGGLLRVETADGRSTSIVRVGRSAFGTLWRYTPPGLLGEEFANFDQTVDVVETPPDGFPVLVGIDGMTGSAKFRIPLPRSSYTALNVRCIEGANARRDRPASVGTTPTVLDGGTVNLAVSTTDDVEDFFPCGTGGVRRHRTVQLVQVSDGSVTYRTVYEFSPVSGESVDVALGKVLPDGHGGQLVMWSERIGSQPVDHTVVRVIGERLIAFHLPALGPMILAEQDMGVTTDGRTLVAFDVTSGEILWTHRADPNGSFRIVTAVGGGGLTVATERGVEHFDRAGQRVLMGDYSR